MLGATVATLSLGGLSVAATEDDPLFAAIESHRAAQERIDAFCDRPQSAEMPGDDDIVIEMQGTETAMLWAILDTTPTTVAGVTAFLAHLNDYLKHGHEFPERQSRPGDLAPEYVQRHPAWAVCSIDFESDAIAFAARSLQRLAAGGR